MVAESSSVSMQGGSHPERTATSAPPARPASAHCVARILREFREIQRNPSPHWCANPLSHEEPYEWHFTLRGPPDSHFEGGLYHGRIVFPKNYPFAPPSLMLLTQNGRFEVNKTVCLSASSYHPELWQPAWGIRTLLDALCAFFPTPGEGALRALDTPEKIRRRLAVESVNWTCPVCKKSNRALVEESYATLGALPDSPVSSPGQQQVSCTPVVAAVESIVSSPARPVDSVSETAASPGSEAAGISAPEAPAARTRINRRRPPRGQRTLLAQMFRIPSTRGEIVVATVDVLLAFFLLAFLFVLADVVLNPPHVKLFPNMKSWWW